MGKKVVVAYSGGLDTTFCVKYLQIEKQYEVHTALVNTGGFSNQELDNVTQRAKSLGVLSHKNIDIVDDYYQKCIRYMIYGNVLKNNTYPLSVSSERAFQAIAMINYAKSIGASAIAHGSTGAGNDQVRFDLIFQILAPEIEIITPIRDLTISRQDEIAYLQKNGYEYQWEKAKYSINQGLWGTSVGGVETLKSDGELPSSAYPSQLKENNPRKISIDFTKGEIKALNGKAMKPQEIIRELNSIASAYAIGRDIHVGDTIIGIKGRVAFEAAASLIIIKAHHLLEKHTLTKWQQYWKEQIGNFYGMLLHEAQYLDPVMRNMETFLESTQDKVTGSVNIELLPYHFNITGCTSPHDMMNNAFGEYGEVNKAFSGEDVIGFTKILSNQTKIWFAVNKEK